MNRIVSIGVRCASFLAVVCLFVFSLPVSAQCVHGNRSPSAPNYYYIRVTVQNPSAAPPGANEAVATAATEWNSKCGGYTGAIPEIWTGAGAPPATYAAVSITFVNAPSAADSDGRCGDFSGASIRVYAYTRLSPASSLIPCSTRSSWSDIIAHELGHRLGLADASSTSGCHYDMMANADGQDRTLTANNSEDCQVADSQNETMDERGNCPVQDCHQSPLVVAMPNTPYRFSCIEDGVTFDLGGQGAEVRTGWTLPDDNVAFLALDRNRNGAIDDGRELFGTGARVFGMPDDTYLNGFDALQPYDFDHDERITSTDPIWSKLRLWFDRNHDGSSMPSELVSLDSRNVLALDLRRTENAAEDVCGNQLRLRARVIFATPAGALQRSYYDVFFRVVPP